MPSALSSLRSLYATAKSAEDVRERGRAGPLFSHEREREKMAQKKWRGMQIFPRLEFHRALRERETEFEGRKERKLDRWRRREEKIEGKERGVAGERGGEERTCKRERGERRGIEGINLPLSLTRARVRREEKERGKRREISFSSPSRARTHM